MLEAEGGREMTFSEKLITLRAGRGWSQETLARELGVSRQAVGRWEKGTGLPDAVGLTSLARVFDVDAGWLLDDASEEPEPRRIRRVQLMWYDWAAISVFTLSLLAWRPLYRYVYEFVHVRLIYYPSALFRLFAGCCVWFAGGWSFSALICRFAAGALPRGWARRTLLTAAAVTAALLFAVYAVFCVLSAGVIRGTLPAPWNWFFGRTAMSIVQHPALFLLPGAALSLCAARRAR